MQNTYITMDQPFFYPYVDMDMSSVFNIGPKPFDMAMVFDPQHQDLSASIGHPFAQPQPMLYIDNVMYTMTVPFADMPTMEPALLPVTPHSPLDGMDQNMPGLTGLHDDNTSVATTMTPSLSPAPVMLPVQHEPSAEPPKKTTKPKPTRRRRAPAEKLPYALNMLSLNLNTTRRPNRSANSSGSSGRPAVPFRCDHPGCEKTFTRPYNLKSHKRTHTAERPYNCEFCTRQFARQHDRNRHAKLHLGFKPYVCIHCGKAFARHDALNRHQRVDPSSQPSSTSLCVSLCARYLKQKAAAS